LFYPPTLLYTRKHNSYEECFVKNTEQSQSKKFSLSTWLIKITSRAFSVWIITTIIVSCTLFVILNRDPIPVITWMPILLLIWGATGIIFIGGNVLIDALSKMVEKSNLTINSSINATANTNISGAVGGKV